MSDDRRPSGTPDLDRIHVHEDYALQCGTRTLGVSADELRAAVKAAGPTSAAVRKRLGQ
ncbi:DUF3606 domain-containing protein [Xanthomonas sp. Kuri4-1]